MPDQEKNRLMSKLRIFPHGIMIILVLSVIFLSVMAIARPSAYGATATIPPSNTPLATEAEPGVTPTVDQTQTQEVLQPPTPEEIGSTNGIIFWSTVLILILLIGTLREAILHKNR